jgi:hypothetical protein
MKPKLIFLLISLGVLNFKISAQTGKYYSMPDSNAYWNTYSRYYPSATRSTTLRIDGDTLYQGILYHKLREIGSLYLPINFYKGAFRDDSIHRKVFFLPNSDTVEQLLYDFNLQIGDTLRTYNTKKTYSRIRIIGLDSILIGSDYRKRWLLSGDHTDAEIIEGIGSTYGFLDLLMPLIEGHPYLTCFSENNKSLYPIYNANEGCPLISSVKIENKSLDFEVYPNPSNGIFTLFSKEKELIIEFYSITGQQIHPIILGSQINMTAFHKGIYFIKVSTTEISILKKMIIQ